MRIKDSNWRETRHQARGIDVQVSNRDVQSFRRKWPCSGIHENARFTFSFESNGDLVDITCSHRYEDGTAIVALADDALMYAIRAMRLAHGHIARLADCCTFSKRERRDSFWYVQGTAFASEYEAMQRQIAIEVAQRGYRLE